MSMINIAIIGSGGREHALYWKVKQSKLAGNVYVLPGNGGIENSVSISVTDFGSIKAFCIENGISLIIVGPEVPLADGIGDFFSGTNISIFGPVKEAAQLEGSKTYAKEFMVKYGVATAPYTKCTGKHEAVLALEEMEECVIKYDGLAAGKGVFVCSSKAEAYDAVDQIEAHYGQNTPMVIEELLVGDEISIIGITDGESIRLLSPSQDHKQAYDNDEGPNTGGMGAFTPVPFADKALLTLIEERIVQPTMNGLKSEPYPFTGVIYFGIMVTADGPKLLEYNVRLGDPETEVIIPALKSDLLELILSCFDGTLDQKSPEFHPGYFVDVVLASGGYPGSYEKGKRITGIENLLDTTLLFHAGTKLQDDILQTDGGRVLNVVAHDDTLEGAIQKVYTEAGKILFDGKQNRT
ncbi:MAG: phosphoribosylamine--glycine ligase, partial [Spirochaetota bacterium]